MGFAVLQESLFLLSLLRVPNPISTSPWFPPHFPLCILPCSDRKSQIFWTNLIYFFLLSLFWLSPLLPKREGLLLAITGHRRAFSHHFQRIPYLCSPKKNLMHLVSVSGHLSHGCVPGQCQWVVLHGRALLYRLVGQVSHVQKESM